MWQWYEFPDGHEELAGGKLSFTWSEMLAEWRWIVADFHAVYHLDLSELFRVKSWRWFEPLVVGLMQLPDSFLHKALVPRH